MKITFFSNFMNHHQKPFCDCMYSILGSNFTFVATKDLPEEQKKLGYSDMNDNLPYIFNAHHGEQEKNTAKQLALDSDAVIYGAAPFGFVAKRLQQKKLTFRYSERFFKEGYWKLLDPRVIWYYYHEAVRHRNDPYYMLCASAYTAPDCRLIHAFPNKTYKWGYFPEVKVYSDVEKLIRLKHPTSILWVGRLIGWKHPEAAVNVAERLKRDGYKFNLNIIGNGAMEYALKQMILDKNLSDCVNMLGAMPPEKVREHMEKSQIFLFTSDQNEGWGAVLNESMNSACAVVANRQIGSVPFLINDGENGLIYDSSYKEFYKKVCYLLDNQNEISRLGRNAYKTMLTTWNGKTAAERLMNLCGSFLGENSFEYKEGPCSRC